MLNYDIMIMIYHIIKTMNMTFILYTWRQELRENALRFYGQSGEDPDFRAQGECLHSQPFPTT